MIMMTNQAFLASSAPGKRVLQHYRHETDILTTLRDVRFQGQSGKHMLASSFSGFDPGCVKTCRSQECAELFSLSSSLSSGRKHFWFSNLRNRGGISTR